MCHTVKHNLLIMMNAFIKNIYAHMLVIIIPLKRKPSQNHLTINGCRYNRNQICSNHKVVFLYYKWNHIFKIDIRVSKKKRFIFKRFAHEFLINEATVSRFAIGEQNIKAIHAFSFNLCQNLSDGRLLRLGSFIFISLLHVFILILLDIKLASPPTGKNVLQITINIQFILPLSDIPPR